MGIDDRDYMRERPSWQPPPRVTRAPLEYAGHPPHSPASRRVSLDYDPDEVEGVQRVRPWRLAAIIAWVLLIAVALMSYGAR